MTLAQEIEVDFASIWQDTKAFVFLGELSIKALVSEMSLEEELELGGFGEQRRITVKLCKKDLMSNIRPGQIMRYDGNEYRVLSVNGKQNFPILSMDLEQK